MKACRIIVCVSMIMLLAVGFCLAAQKGAVGQPMKHRGSGIAPAGPAGPHAVGPQGAFGPGLHLQALSAYVGLSKEQAERIRQISNRSRMESRDVRYDLLQMRIEMHRMFTDPKTSPQMLSAKTKELSALQQKLMERRMQALIEARGVLTPEQIQRLDEIPSMMGRGRMRGGMMGHWMMESGCPRMMGEAGLDEEMMATFMPPYGPFEGAWDEDIEEGME